MRKLKLITKILIVAFVIGLSLLLYPSFSNYWNLKHATRALNSYSDSIADIDENSYETIWKSAVEYNRLLQKRQSGYALPADLKVRYLSELEVAESGLMGFVDIPSIGVSLPIYHGTSESVLQVGIGHLEWSSLPTGGESTHCVLSGHRGLPSAKLFTDLNKLREGDVFTLKVLNETLTYEVDQIRTVLPNETDGILIEEGMDYCTLITCTPYGINTHRLLVRGHRIENAQEAVTIRITADAIQIEPLLVAPVLAVPLLLIALTVSVIANIIMIVLLLQKPRRTAVPSTPAELTTDPSAAPADPSERTDFEIDLLE